MGKNRTLRVFVWGSVAALIVLAGLGLFLFSRIPSLADLIRPGSSGLVVHITSPVNGDSLDPAGTTTVLAEALGARPVASLQLWVDGALLGSKAPAGGAREGVSIYWAWVPVAGQHILVAGATDEQGRTAYSDPVVVFAADPAGGGTGTYLSLPGESLDDVAGKLGLDPGSLAASNPGLAVGPLPPGSPVSVPLPGPSAPVSFPPGPSGPAGGEPAPDAPGKLAVWLSLRTGGGGTPSAPALTATASGCSAVLSITPAGPGAEGIFVYRLAGGSTSFERIAALGPGETGRAFAYADSGVYGPQLYYAAAFNASGESSSGLAGISVSDPACKPAEPSSYSLTRLAITPAQPLDSMYCYFSFGDGLWTRLPAGDGTFVYPLDGSFDFSPYAGLLPSSSFTLQSQCWGWRAGVLVELGEASGPRPAPDGAFGLSAVEYAVAGLVAPADPFGGVWEVRGPEPGTGPIMPPGDLTRTASLDSCKAHGGPALLCGPAVTLNQLILVWNWVPTCIFDVEGAKYKCSDYITETDGFHVYAALPGKTFGLVATVHDRKQFVYFFDAGRFPVGTRFIVRAYAGLFESPDSNVYVLADIGPGTETITLTPKTLHTTDAFDADEDCDIDISGSGGPGLGTDAVWTDGVNVTVGQDYGYYGPGDCRNWTDHRLYGRVSFDLSSVTRPVASAQLSFTQGFSIADQYLYIVPCLDQLGMITSLSGSDPAGWDAYRDLPSAGAKGTHHSVDATDLVRDWQLGSPNLGFVLSPQIDATHGDPYTQQCWTTLEDFQLTVTYFK